MEATSYGTVSDSGQNGMRARGLVDNGAVVYRPAAWGAVFAMSVCVFVLIASEFMPVSLLTPIAADLALTEGEAGRAISVSGIFAVLTSLFIPTLTRGLDRKVLRFRRAARRARFA